MKQLTYTNLVPTEDGNGFADANGKIWKQLNSKQKKFCREYLKGQTATQAAIKAGYTKDRKGAKTQGSVLLNHNPVVRNYLIELEIAASERDAVSLENHLSTLHDLREEAKDQGQISIQLPEPKPYPCIPLSVVRGPRSAIHGLFTLLYFGTNL